MNGENHAVPGCEPVMKKIALAAFVLSMSTKLVFGDSTNLGVFSGQADIGNVTQPGSVSFNPANGEYLFP